MVAPASKSGGGGQMGGQDNFKGGQEPQKVIGFVHFEQENTDFFLDFTQRWGPVPRRAATFILSRRCNVIFIGTNLTI